MRTSALAFILMLGALAASAAQAAPAKGRKPSSAATSRASVDREGFRRVDSMFKGRLEVEPGLGLAFTGPSDVNRLIRDTNSGIQKQGVESFSIGELGPTAAFGFAATYKLLPSLGVGLGFTRMTSSTEGSARVNSDNLYGKFSIGSTLLTAETRLRVYESQDGRLEGLVAPFLGIGFHGMTEEFSGSALAKGSQAVESSAAGAVFGSTVAARYWILENLSVGANAGYRFAKSGVLTVDSQKNTSQPVGSQVENNGRKVRLDASSLLFGAQVTLAI